MIVPTAKMSSQEERKCYYLMFVFLLFGICCDGKLPDCSADCWQEWSIWSDCNKETCNEQRFRTQTYNPDCICQGNELDSRRCLDRTQCNKCLRSVWQEWQDWNPCNTSCFRSRYRVCKSDSFNCINIRCKGGSGSDEAHCEYGACCMTAKWSAWSEWGACSVLCDQGISTRTRTCDKPMCKCPGSGQRSRLCAGPCCDASSITEYPWTEWSKCSVTCGQGFRSKSRACGNGDDLVTQDVCTGPPCKATGKPFSEYVIIISIVGISVLVLVVAVLLFFFCRDRKARAKRLADWEREQSFRDAAYPPHAEEEGGTSDGRRRVSITTPETRRSIDISFRSHDDPSQQEESSVVTSVSGSETESLTSGVEQSSQSEPSSSRQGRPRGREAGREQPQWNVAVRRMSSSLPAEQSRLPANRRPSRSADNFVSYRRPSQPVDAPWGGDSRVRVRRRSSQLER